MMVVEEPGLSSSRQVGMRWFLSSGGGNGTAAYELFPKSNLDLIFRCSDSSCQMLILGPVTKRVRVEFDQASEYLGIRFRPGQAPRLADVSPSDLIDGSVELTKIMGEEVDSLAERLRLLPNRASKYVALEGLARGTQPLIQDERCRRGATLIEARSGQLQVSELAAELGLSVRSLERLFHSQLGIPPKRLTRLVRLRQLVSTLRAGNFRSFGDLAYLYGYSDQAHMIKDFKELTGRLPGETRNRQATRLAHSLPSAIQNRQVSHTGLSLTA